MPPFTRWKSKILPAVFIINGVFLFCLGVKNANASHSTATYSKAPTSTLESADWNNLLNDFVTTWTPNRMEGPLGIGMNAPVSGLGVEGLIYASNNLGIGTTNPGANTLGIIGGINASGSVSANAFCFGANCITSWDGLGGGGLWGGTATGSIWNLNSGNIGIGTTNPEANFHVAANDFTTSLMDVAGNTWWYGNYDYYRRSRGTIASKAAVQNGDLIVNHNYQGYDGTGYQSGAGFQVKVDGAVSSGIVPMQYYIENRGADGTWRQNLVIRSSGNVGIGTTNPGNKFSVSGGTGDVINVAGGSIGGLNSTPVNADQAVPLGYLQSNYISSGAASSTGWLLTGNTVAGDTSWLGTLSNNDISFRTNNLERMRIQKAGNVGIGITNPWSKLFVNSTGQRTLYTTGSWDTSGSSSIYDNTLSTTITPTANEATGKDYISLKTSLIFDNTNYTYNSGDQGRSFYMEAKYLGSQTFPDLRTSFMDLYNTGSGSLSKAYNIVNLIRNTGTGTIGNAYGISNESPVNSGGGTISNYYGFYQKDATAPTNAYAFYSALNSGTGNRYGLYMAGTAPNYFNGSVGIGTTNPGALVEISTTGTANNLKLNSTGGGVTGLSIATDGVIKGYWAAARNSGQYFTDAAPGDMAFRSESNKILFGQGTGVSTMAVNAGNVGIGTTTPANKLMVYGGTGDVINVAGGSIGGLNSTPVNSDQAVPLGYLQNNFAPKGTGVGSAFVQGGNSFGAAANLGTNDNYALNFETNNSNRMTILTNGNVGIGTTSPTQALEVNGVARVSKIWAGSNADYGQLLWLDGGSSDAVGRLTSAGGNTYMDLTASQSGSGNKSAAFRFAVNAAWAWYTGVNGGDSNKYEIGSGPTLGNNVALAIQQDGKVGIGTAAPTNPLSIVYDDNNYLRGINIKNSNSNSHAISGLSLMNSSGTIKGSFDYYSTNYANPVIRDTAVFSTLGQTTGLAFISGADYPTLNGGDIYFQSGSTNPNLYIKGSTGNVGIGTTTPANKLTVNGGTGDVINVAGGSIGGLNSTPVNADQAVPLGYLQSNFAPKGTGTGSAFVQGGNSFGATATLGTNDNYALNLVTNSSNRMTILTNGNVGVGTTNPQNKLDVTGGSARVFTGNRGFILSANSGTAGLAFLNYGVRHAGIFSDGTDIWWGNASANENNSDVWTKLGVLTAGGNVGIGTTTPAGKLDVYGDIYRSGIRFLSGDSTYHVIYKPGGSAGMYLGGTSDPSNYYDGDNHYFRNTGGSTYYMSIKSTGNVGIGTSTPGNKLTVNGGTGDVINVAGGSIGGLNSTPVNADQAVPLGYLQSNFAPKGTGNGSAFVQGGNSFGTTATLGTNDNNPLNFETNSSNRMTILANGNVGIGNTNPSYLLHVGGKAAMTNLYLNNSGSTNRNITVWAAGNERNLIGVDYNVDGNKFRIGADTIIGDYTTGNVGIGITNPNSNAALHLNKNQNTGTSMFVSNSNGGNSAQASIRAGLDPSDYANNYVAMGIMGAGYTPPPDPLGQIIKPKTTYIEGNGADFWIGNYSNTEPIIFTTTNSRTERLRITAAGNVGIGTTTPANKLTVNGGTGDVINVAGGSIGGLNSTPVNADQAVPLGYLQSNFAPKGTGTGSAFVQGGNSFGTAATLGTNDNYALNFETNSSTQMTILANGNVGIATTNPGSKLTVSGADNKDSGPILNLSGSSVNQFESGRVRFTETTVAASPFYQGAFFHYDGSGNTFNIGVHEAADALQASDINSIRITRNTGSVNIGNGALFTQYNGNVGIGTTTPSYPLTINDTSFDGPVISAFDGYYQYNIGGTTSGPVGPNSNYFSIYKFQNKAHIDVGTSALSIESTSVGIGTTTPANKLTVNGGTGDVINVAGGSIGGLNSTPVNADQAVPLGYLQANYSATGGSLWKGTLNGNIWNGDAGAGNVGIGTASPMAKLQVYVSSSTAQSLTDGFSSQRLEYDGGWNQGDTGAQITFAQRYNSSDSALVRTGAIRGIKTYGTGSFGGGLQLLYQTNGASNMAPGLTLNHSGNIGIGTTNPLAKLEVWHVNSSTDPNASSYPLKLYNNSWSGSQITGIEFWNGFNKVVPTSRIISQMNGGGATGENLYFQTQSSSGTNPNPNQPTTKLMITADGSVGIGTTNPGAKLSFGNPGNTDVIRLYDDGTYISGFSIGSGQTTRLFGDDYNRLIQFGSQTKAGVFTESMRIQNGNVGIGTTTSANKLTVNGGTGDVINVLGGSIGGLNSTPVNADQAVPLGYLQSNYSSSASSSAGSLWKGTLNGNIWNGDAGAGKVGIGTTSPTHKLHIYDNSAVTNSVTQAQLYIQNAYNNMSGHASIVLDKGAANASAAFGFLSAGVSEWDAGIIDGNNFVIRDDINNKKVITAEQGAGDNALYIQSGGRVGIGTSNPASALSVISSTTQTFNGQNYYKLANFTAGGGYNYSMYGSSNNGNDGLVISTPNTAFRVDIGNRLGDALLFGGGDSGSGNNTFFSVSRTAANGGDILLDAFNSGVGGSDIVLNSRFGVGNVGISSTTPAIKLSVNGGTGDVVNVAGGFIGGLASTPVRVDQAVPLGYLQDNFAPKGTGTGSAFVQGGNSFGAVANLGTNDNYALNFKANNSTWMTILANGNVGIGTTNPVSSLQANKSSQTIGAVTPSGALLVTGLAQGNGALELGNDANAISWLQSRNLTNQTYYNLALQPSGGNVGIGTTTPAIKLTVNGGTGDVINVAGGFIGGLNSTPVNADQAVPLGYLQSNYIPNGAASSTGWLLTGNTLTSDNSWLGSINNYDVSFRTNNTERMRILKGGNVGIGLTNPGTKLDVLGSLNTSAGYYYGSVNSPMNIELTRTIPTAVNDYVEIGNFNLGNGAHNFRVSITNSDSGFSVSKAYVIPVQYSGTGNTWEVVPPVSDAGPYNSNDYALDINVNTTVASLRIRRTLGTLGGTAKIRIESVGATNDVFTATSGTGTAAAISILYQPLYQSAVTGNVGIGTTNPGATLEIAKNVYAGPEALRLTNLDTNLGGGPYMSFYDGIKDIAHISSGPTTAGNGSAGYLAFSTRKAETITEQMRIDNNGNVGIGTTTPAIKLTVNGGTGDAINVAGGFIGGLAIVPSNRDQAVSLGYLQDNYSQSSGSLWKGTLNGTIWNGDAGAGNVGIGTINPTGKLTISGSMGDSRSVSINNREIKFRGDGVTHISLFGPDTGKPYLSFTNTSSNSLTGTSGSDLAVITSSGNVGIGTTTPGQLLTLQSNSPTIRLQETGSPTSYYTDFVDQWNSGEPFFINNSGTKILGSKNLASTRDTYLNSYYGLAFSTGVTDPTISNVRMVINNTGNVGIGLTNPSTLLSLAGSVLNNPQPVLSLDVNNWFTMAHSSGYGSINFFTRADGTNWLNTHASVRASQISTGDGSLIFSTAATNAGLGAVTALNTRMTINANGNVGIGSTTPAIKLSVDNGTGDVINAGNGYIGGLAITPVNRDQAVTLGYLQDNYTPGSGGWILDGNSLNNDTHWLGSLGNNDISFRTNNAERMRILKGGNVGIGITNPQAMLHVNGGMILKHTAVADSNYTVASTDYIVAYTSISANRTVTLPNSLCTPGRFFVIVDESGSASSGAKIIIDPEGTTPIVGQQTFFLQNPYNSVYVFCGNSAWYVL